MRFIILNLLHLKNSGLVKDVLEDLKEIKNLYTDNNFIDSSNNPYSKLISFLELNLEENENELQKIDLDYLNDSKFDKTLMVTHSSSYKHGELNAEKNLFTRIKRRCYQVENPDRLSVLLDPSIGVLNSDFFRERFTCEFTNNQASLADILRVHDFAYIDGIKNLCEDLKSNNKTKMYKYDSDTYINQHTWESAAFAAGSVIHAVDKVMTGEYKNAICLVRPPGHHAGYFGKVESEEVQCPSSNGFCFINNVAVGAAYCKYRYKAKKIAIVDFDVHHGNGTEEIIQFLKKTNLTIKSENKICSLNVNKTVFNPWLDYDDAENVLFVSLHGYDEESPGLFYPSTGHSDGNTKMESSTYPGGILNIPIAKSNSYSHCYRKLFRAKVLPRLIKFKPDIIFVSAGFDGHQHEEINLSYMKLNEFDYKWITEELMKVSNTFCGGKLISVLEGGYNINSGVVSSFAQSVMAHSKFLNIGLNKNKEECRIISKMKRMREYDRELENFKLFKKFKFGESTVQEEKNNFENLRSLRRNIKSNENNLNNDEKMQVDEENNFQLDEPYPNYNKSVHDLNEVQQIAMEHAFDTFNQINENVQDHTGQGKEFNFFVENERHSENSCEDLKDIYVKQVINEIQADLNIENEKKKESNSYFMPEINVEEKEVKKEEVPPKQDIDEEIEVELDDLDDLDD